MSLKENVEYIKEEISTQESFLENFFKVEKFAKKYKKPLIGFTVAIVVAIAGVNINSYIKEQNRLKANTLFEQALKNPQDSKLLDSLKQADGKLYNIALYLKDNTTITDVEFLKELAIYNKAIKQNDDKTIAKATINQKFLLKDFAIFNQALILAQKGDYKAAKDKLALIPITSSVSKLSKMLEHFLVTK
jgi:hypothetical protein